MRNILTIAFLLALDFGLTACSSSLYEEEWTPWHLSTERQDRVVELNYQAQQLQLSVAQRQRISQTKRAMAAKTACHAVININRIQPLTEERIRDLTSFLITQGITARYIKVKNIMPVKKEISDITLHLEEYETVVPRCPGWTQAMTDAYGQNVGPGGELNFGCTTQYNLARMIAHPKDVIEPNKLGPGDGYYLGKAVDDLRKNKQSSSDSTKKASNLSGVSNAGGSSNSDSTPN